MPSLDTKLTVTVTLMAAIIAAVVSVALPLTYYLNARNSIYIALETEAEINARIAAQVVAASPELWHYQKPKLVEFLQRRPRRGEPEIRRIIDLQGKTVAESADPLPSPLEWRANDIMDSGVKVAEIRIARSLQPLLLETGEMALLGLGIGAGLFVVLRVLPLRALQRAIDANVILVRDLQFREAALTRSNEQLRRHERELLQSNAELEQFAYVASHDLQEPLRMVTIYSQSLAKDASDQLGDDAKEDLGFIIDAAKRMRRLIDDLLTYSRIGTGGNPFQRTDVNAALQSSLQSLSLAIEESDAVITQDLLPTITCDSGQIEQLMQNLIGNAIKYRNGQAPRVHVSSERQDNGWLFRVQDNGIGIAPEFAEQIFVIFQRLHTREEFPGTGIGLAVCKKIVERHDGKIWVESQPGNGSTFCFSIPDQRTAHEV